MTDELLSALTGFQRDVLYTLAGMDQPSGQDLKAELEREFDRNVSHGLLYPNLDELSERDLIRKGHIDRRTNYYEVTDEGLKAIHERRNWEDARLEANARLQEVVEAR